MSNISIERLEDLAKGQYFLAEVAYIEAQEMARELLEYRNAKPVGITDRSEIECLCRGEMANVMPPDYKGVDKGDEVFIYAAPQLQPVSNPYTLPDGWVMVPVEPTESMVIEGFESEPNENFSEQETWEAYQEMSGCQQAAHKAELCWAAMIAAAPQPDKCHK